MPAKTNGSMLVVAALFLCGCGCGQVNDGVQGALLAEIKRLGGRFELNEATWAVTLIFADRAVEDAELSCLKGLDKLRGLSLRGFLVTDAGLDHVKGLTHLQTLDLHFTGVTDAGLVHLKDLKDLRRLSLDGSFLVTDSGLAHLKGLAGLRELGLTFTRVTDAGVDDLQKTLPDLQIRRRYGQGRASAGMIDGAKARPSTVRQGPPDNRGEQRGSRPSCLSCLPRARHRKPPAASLLASRFPNDSRSPVSTSNSAS